MHSAPGLVCSDRPEGRLLSRFDPSATQTVSTDCIRRSGMAVQGPPLRALPVSPCVHKGCRGRPYPVTGSGRQDPQLPRRLAYSSPIQRAVGRSQGLGAPAPQPVGASGQLGKEQALPCAENLFSRCGVRLGEYDGTPHGGTCPSSAELPEFLRGRNVVPLRQFQRLLGHMASAAAVTPLGLLHMRPLQHWLHSRVPRWAWRGARVTIPLRDFRKNAELSMCGLTTEWILESAQSLACALTITWILEERSVPWSGELLIPQSERELRRSEGSGKLIDDLLW